MQPPFGHVQVRIVFNSDVGSPEETEDFGRILSRCWRQDLFAIQVRLSNNPRIDWAHRREEQESMTRGTRFIYYCRYNGYKSSDETNGQIPWLECTRLQEEKAAEVQHCATNMLWLQLCKLLVT